jgi:hypothetical protein
MKKKIAFSIIPIILLLFIFNVYNSKKEFYLKQNEFYDQIFTSEVTKIIEGRGTKIYYNSNEYFYSDYCEDEYKLEKIIKVGDILEKKTGILEVYRGGKNNKLINCKVVKPKKTYFQNFFGL